MNLLLDAKQIHNNFDMTVNTLFNSALVIEQQALAQSHLRYSLRSIGFNRVDLVDRSYLAIKALKNSTYDLVVCSSSLNDSCDGYQLFELIRTNNLISPTTCFVFLSSDTKIDKSRSVLELKPDDCVVKPYSVQTIQQRLLKALNKKLLFKPYYQLIEKQAYSEASLYLSRQLAGNDDRFQTMQLLKLKGELIVKTEQWQTAESFYEKICQAYSSPWAHLAYAQTLIELNKIEHAEHILNSLKENPATELQAYDLLTKIHTKSQNYELAAVYTKHAAGLSSRNIVRLKQLLALSRLVHDFETQYKISHSIINEVRHSVYESSEHYFTAIRSNIDFALTSLNEEHAYHLTKSCHNMFGRIKTLYPTSVNTESYSIMQARLFNLRNDKDYAKRLVKKSIEQQDINNVEDGLDKAKALHELGFYRESELAFENLMEYALQNSSDDIIKTHILEQMKLRKDIKESPKNINNYAVVSFESGSYFKAFESFKKAFRLMPKNPSIILNLMQSSIELMKHQPDQKLQQTIEMCEQSLGKLQLSIEQSNRYQKLTRLNNIAA